MSYFTNFAKYGNPNGEGLPEWTPYTLENPCSMILCDDAHMDGMEKNVGVMTALHME